jgi:hypothetical protein
VDKIKSERNLPMSIISSKQPQKKHSTIDFISIFAALVLIFLILVPINNSRNGSFRGAFQHFSSASAGLSVNQEISFSSDLQYWDANCSQGWGNDAMCNNIAARAQSCSISMDSAYCSAYNTYMQQNLKK